MDLYYIGTFVSITANAVLATLLLKKKKQKKELTTDASAILHDLTRGPSLLKIEYINRDDIFLKSPRER